MSTNCRNIFFLFCMLVGIASVFPSTEGHAESKLVYRIPVKHTIETGLQKFLERAFKEAHHSEADAIVLEINTPGGEVNAAGDIGLLIRHSEIPVTAFVVDEAFSAGTYIALNADHLIMSPGSAIGSAAPITLTGNTAGKKAVAAWTQKMIAAAELNNRDPLIAEAMVDPDVEIEGVVEKGELLALGPKAANEYGYADHITSSFEGVMDYLKIQDPTVISVDLTMGEKVARFLTSPIAITILFTIGLAGIIGEIFTPGFGVSGTIGLLAFGLYFFGGYVAGFADMLHIVIFVIGIILMLIEVFVPGFGVFGIAGLIGIIFSLVMATHDARTGLIALGIALVITILVAYVIIKYFGHSGVWNKFILRDKQDNKTGYVSMENDPELVGKTGTAITPLRPAGTAVIENQRYDVVSEGNFIANGSSIEVIKMEGSRIVVRVVESD